MRKLIGSLVLILALTMWVAALGETQETWNSSCSWQLAGEARVWTLPSQAAAGAEAVTTLPANTWVKPVTRDGQWMVIDYFADGSVHSGTVQADLVLPADGSATPAPTSQPLPIAKATAKAPTVTAAPETPQSLPEGLLLVVDEPTAAPQATATPSASFTVSVVYEDEILDAQILTLGSCTTLVSAQGVQYEVSTANITCSETVSAGHQIGVITAPKGGTATLRAGASAKTTSLGKLKDGQLVCVLEEGTDFCHIWTPEASGYVATSVLSFDVYVADPVGKAILQSEKGKTSGKGSVNVRVAPKKNAKKSNELPLGTEVTVLKIQGDWYFIEYNGQRGYVYTSFIQDLRSAVLTCFISCT